MVFGLALQDEGEVRAFLVRLAVKYEKPRNAAEYLASQIGTELTDLFFRPYTKKMWALDLEDMDASVVKRIPLRFDDEDHYFPADKFQMMPRDGYTSIITRILDHPEIKVMVATPFEKSCSQTIIFASTACRLTNISMLPTARYHTAQSAFITERSSSTAALATLPW